jgi:hypothetical protein
MHQTGSGDNLPIADRVLWTIFRASRTTSDRDSATITTRSKFITVDYNPRRNRKSSTTPFDTNFPCTTTGTSSTLFGLLQLFTSSRLTSRHIPSHHIASPRLSSPAMHYITSGHTSHRIGSTRQPPLRTRIRYRYHQYQHEQKKKKSLDRQIDIDLQDVHYGPYRTGYLSVVNAAP